MTGNEESSGSRKTPFFSDPLTGSWFLFVLGLGHRVSSHFLSLPLVKVPITPELKHRFPSLCSLQRHRTGTQMKPCLPGQASSGCVWLQSHHEWMPCNSNISDLPISLSYRVSWSSVGPKNLSDNYSILIFLDVIWYIPLDDADHERR